MRRTLLGGLLLAALALLVLFTLHKTRAHAPPVSGVANDAEALAEPHAALEAESMDDRAQLATEDRVPQSTAADAARPTPDAHAAAPVVKKSQVTIVVEFTDSGKPIGVAQANLEYLEPARTQAENVGGSPRTVESHETHRMAPAGLGKFVLDVPVGARLQLANVCGLPGSLDGPRTESNAASRFRPLQAPLDLVVGDAPVEIRLTAEAGRDIRGSVCDARTMRPLAGAKLSIRTAVGRYLKSSTDLEGRFVIGEAAARTSMTVEHRGYCALGLTLDADRYVKGTTDLVVLLEPTLHVAGHVVDARGAPVPLVRIRFFARRLQHQPLGKQLTETLSVQSDAQGNFRLDGIPPCEDAVLSGDDAQEPKRIEFVPRREIGALNADLDGLVLVCPDSAVISIRVLQPDGTPVAPGLFQVVEEANLTRFAGSNWLRPDYLVRVPVGVELHFVALARTNPEEARSVMVGRRSLILSTSKPEPQEFQITLGERFDYEPPPTDAQVIDIVKPDIQATLDLRLLDKSGGPLGADTEVVLIPILGERVALHPSDGWIRLRGFPGLNSVRFQAGDESEVMEIVIPPSGYGRSERQLNIGP